MGDRKDLNIKKETIIIEEEIIGKFFYRNIEYYFLLWTQDPEVRKEITDKFDYKKIKNIINKVKKTNNKVGGNCNSYYIDIIALIYRLQEINK